MPPEAGCIQVNFCKNPVCPNFGVHPEPVVPRGQPAHGGRGGRHKITGLGKGAPALYCKACKEAPPLKSNVGIHEELERIGAYLAPPRPPSCPDPGCANHGVPAGTKGAYRRHGTTRGGSIRYLCKRCGGLFSVPKATTGQKAPEKNALVFKLLVNKAPFRRLCDLAGISTGTLYPKIDFLYRQCLAFAGECERGLEALSKRRVYASVDRQDYLVNWNHRGDKRNVQLTAVGSADNDSGYVFGMDLNFAGGLDPREVEQDAIACGDYELSAPFRKYARLWLERDYLAPTRRGGGSRPKAGLAAEIENTYAEALQRPDVESPDSPSALRRLPANGMQVHSDYTLYAHFQLLRRLFAATGKVRFFLDQESGIRAACLAAFHERVRDETCEAFYVRINKDLTVDKRRRAMRKSREAFKKVRAAHPGLGETEVKLLLIKERMRAARQFGHWRDRWVAHPFPNMSEPEKAVCWLTDRGQYDEDHRAWLYNRASLHGIDRFFMQVRRRLSLLERPIGSASSLGRIWYGYSAYNPEIIVKVLAIFRVYYNYVLTGGDGKTPAMRLGLAGAPVTHESVINYSKRKQVEPKLIR